MAWRRVQTHSDKICAPDVRQKTSPALCWNGHCCPWHLHGRCHFRHMEKAEWQLEAQDEASPCKTCDDLQEEVGQLRKEISELRKALQCLQTSEREDAGGTRKKKRRKRTKGEQPLAPSRPEEGAELEITNSDLEVAELTNLSPKQLREYKIIKANDAAKEKKEATDAEAKEMPPTSVEGEEEEESKDQSDDESEEETEDEDEESETTPPIGETSDKNDQKGRARKLLKTNHQMTYVPDEKDLEQETEPPEETEDEDEEGETTSAASEVRTPPPPPWRRGRVTAQPCGCEGKGKGKRGRHPERGKAKEDQGKGNKWKNWLNNWNGGPR